MAWREKSVFEVINHFSQDLRKNGPKWIGEKQLLFLRLRMAKWVINAALPCVLHHLITIISGITSVYRIRGAAAGNTQWRTNEIKKKKKEISHVMGRSRNWSRVFLISFLFSSTGVRLLYNM